MNQAMTALQIANEARSHRALIKQGLKTGTVTVQLVLEDELCARMRVFDVLRSLPSVGPARANELLREAGVSTVQMKVQNLTPRQRVALVAVVAERRHQRTAA